MGSLRAPRSLGLELLALGGVDVLEVAVDGPQHPALLLSLGSGGSGILLRLLHKQGRTRWGRRGTPLRQPQDARDALTLEPEHERLLTALGSRQKFEELPAPEQRRIFRQIVSKVVLAPGRGSAAERIEITFADGTVHPAPFNPDAVPAA